MARTETAFLEQAAKLRQGQIDAYHLGLNLQDIARQDDFVLARVAGLASGFLLDWARMVDGLIREFDGSGEPKQR